MRRTRYRRLRGAGIVALATLLTVAAWAAVGSGLLDEGFGDGGVVRVAVGSGELLGFAEQSDGKLIAAGHDTTDGTRRWRVRRFNTDGTLDTTFGSSGVVSLFDGSGSDQANDVEVDASDRIVMVGWMQEEVTVSVGKGGKTKTELRRLSVLVRLLADGDLDTGFADGGVRVLDGLAGHRADDVLVQPDGKILVAGSASVTSGQGRNKTTSLAIALLRFDANGDPDGTFGDGGVALDDISADNDVPYLDSVALQSDGSILVSFRRTSTTGSNIGANWNIARYGTDGARDTSFGSGGIVAESGDNGRQIVVDSSDRIIAIGTRPFGINDADGVVRRYAPDGDLDTSFGDGGVFLSGISGRDEFYTVSVTTGDQPVLAGVVWPQGGDTWVVDAVTIRLDTDGARDSAYGTGGTSEPSSASDQRADFVRSFRVDSAGDYVIAGESYIMNTAGSAQWLLVRWQQ